MNLLDAKHLAGLTPGIGGKQEVLVTELQRMVDASLRRLYRGDRYRPEVKVDLSADEPALIRRPGYNHGLGVDGHPSSDSAWWWQRWLEIRLREHSGANEAVRVGIPWPLRPEDDGVAAEVVGGHEGLFVGGPRIPVIQARLTPDLHVLAPRRRKGYLPENANRPSDESEGPFEVVLVPDWGPLLILKLNDTQYRNTLPYYVLPKLPKGTRRSCGRRGLRSRLTGYSACSRDRTRHVISRSPRLMRSSTRLRVRGDLATYKQLLAKQFPSTKPGRVARAKESDAVERQFTTRLAYWLRANTHSISSEPPCPEPILKPTTQPDLDGEFRAVAQEFVDRPAHTKGMAAAPISPVSPVVGPPRGGELRYWPHHLVATLQRGVRTAEATLAGRPAKDKPKADATDTAKNKFEQEVIDTLRWALASCLSDLVVGRGDLAGLLLAPNDTDTLSRLEQYRQVTFFGPGGLSKNLRGRLDLRRLDESWQHVLCPVQTPESNDIGLVRFLALGSTNESAAGDGRDLSAAAALIPYLNHNDPARAALGAKNLKQAVPLVHPEAPSVATGWEKKLALAGTVGRPSDADGLGKLKRYGPVNVYRPGPVSRWEVDEHGASAWAPDVIGADDPSAGPSLALGCNALVALTPWFGFNYEDGVVVSDSFARRMRSRHNVVIRQSLDGSEHAAGWKQLQEDGTEVAAGQPIVRIGIDRYLNAPEAGVLRSVFEDSEGLRAIMEVTRTLEVGDKVTNRHGGKGVVCAVLPNDEMPRIDMPGSSVLDESLVEVVLNPLGVLNRLNFGQLWEMHDSLVKVLAHDLPLTVRGGLSPLPEVAARIIPERGKLHRDWLNALATHLWPEDSDETTSDRREALKRGRLMLKVGKDGADFGDPKVGVVVGTQYLLKLDHLAADKCRARDEHGARSARTLQPLRRTVWDMGKVSASPQRMGEMEVWGLQTVGAGEVLKDLVWERGRAARKGDGPKPSLEAATAHLRVAGFDVIVRQGHDHLGGPGINIRFAVSELEAVRDSWLSEIAGASDDLVRDKHPLYRPELFGSLDETDVRWCIMLPEPVPHPWDPFAPPITQLGILPPAMRTHGADPIDRAYRDVADAVLGMRKELASDHDSKAANTQRAALADAVECVLGSTDHYQRYKSRIVAGGWRTIRSNPSEDLSSAVQSFTYALTGITPSADVAVDISAEAEDVVATNGQDSDPNSQASDGDEAKTDPEDDRLSEEAVSRELAEFKSQIANGADYAGIGRRTGRALRVPRDASILARLEGKMGLLRRHLLGHAAVLSGRAVIVGDPTLDPDQIRLPWTIYRDIVGQVSRDSEITQDLVDTFPDGIEPGDSLDTVVLLNRQPTLRPNAMLALKARWWPGRALVINPMVLGCLAGDFDGDTAAVHWPVNPKARAEAWDQFRPDVRLPNLASAHSTLAKVDLDVALGVHLATLREGGVDDVRRALGIDLGKGVKADDFEESVVTRLNSTEQSSTLAHDAPWLGEVFAFGCEKASGWSIGALDLLLDRTESQPFTQAQAAKVVGRSKVLEGALRSSKADVENESDTLLTGLDSETWFQTAPESIDGLAVKKLLTSEAGTFTKDLVELGYEVYVDKDDCGAGSHSPLACQCSPPAICRACLGDIVRYVDFDRNPAVGQLAGMLIGEYSTQRTLKKDTSDTLSNLQPLFGGHGPILMPPPPLPEGSVVELAEKYKLPLWLGLSAHQSAPEALRFVLEKFGSATDWKIDLVWAEILLRQLWCAAKVPPPDARKLLRPSLVVLARSAIAEYRANNATLDKTEQIPISKKQREAQEKIVQDFVGRAEDSITDASVMDLWHQRWVVDLPKERTTVIDQFESRPRNALRYEEEGAVPIRVINADGTRRKGVKGDPHVVDLAQPLARELLRAAQRLAGPENSLQTLLSFAINSRATAMGLGTIRGNVSHLVQRVRQESRPSTESGAYPASYRNNLLAGKF